MCAWLPFTTGGCSVASAKQAIVIPKQKNIPEAYVTPTPFPAASETTVIYTSPDHARYELFRDLNTTQHSFELFMYQVTDFGLCQELQRLYTNTTIDLTVGYHRTRASTTSLWLSVGGWPCRSTSPSTSMPLAIRHSRRSATGSCTRQVRLSI